MITIAIIVAILVLAIIFFVSLIFQKMIIQPIANLAALADRISMGDLNVEIPIDTNNEIGLLAKSFDRLKTSLKIGMQAFGTNR
jgi:HAMP domain-containing protein